MSLESKFDNSAVRRQDRLLAWERAAELLGGAEYGFLALGGESGYGVPLNFVLDGERLYFHCAPEGEKLRRAELCPEACFCVVGRTQPQPAKFTTLYESVLVFGRIEVVADDRERMGALERLVAKYSPEFREIGRKYSEASFHRTTILRMHISRISAKSKKG